MHSKQSLDSSIDISSHNKQRTWFLPIYDPKRQPQVREMLHTFVMPQGTRALTCTAGSGSNPKLSRKTSRTFSTRNHLNTDTINEAISVTRSYSNLYGDQPSAAESGRKVLCGRHETKRSHWFGHAYRSRAFGPATKLISPCCGCVTTDRDLELSDSRSFGRIRLRQTQNPSIIS